MRALRLPLALLSVLAGCSERPEAKTEKAPSQDQTSADDSAASLAFWRHQSLIPSARFRDPAPPAGAVRVELVETQLSVDFRPVGKTLDNAGGAIDTALPDLQQRYAFQHLRRAVQGRPQHAAAELWVAPSEAPLDFARVLVSLLQADVRSIHLAVQDVDPSTQRRGWLVLEDVRVFEQDKLAATFEPHAFMPWSTLIERLPALLESCKRARNEECKPPRVKASQESRAVISFELGSTYIDRIPYEPDDVRAEFDIDVYHLPDAAAAEFFRKLGENGAWPMILPSSPQHWGVVLGYMYPDGTRLPPIGFPVEPPA